MSDERSVTGKLFDADHCQHETPRYTTPCAHNIVGNRQIQRRCKPMLVEERGRFVNEVINLKKLAHSNAAHRNAAKKMTHRRR